MNISHIIQRLETIPELSGKVIVGNPTYMEHLGSTPYAWISDVTEIPGANLRLNGPVLQRVQVRVEIRIGARDLNEMQSIRDKIRLTLLNYQSDPIDDPMTKGPGQMDFQDPSWCLWTDIFETAYHIDTLH